MQHLIDVAHSGRPEFSGITRACEHVTCFSPSSFTAFNPFGLFFSSSDTVLLERSAWLMLRIVEGLHFMNNSCYTLLSFAVLLSLTLLDAALWHSEWVFI